MQITLTEKSGEVIDVTNYVVKGFTITRTRTEELDSGQLSLVGIRKLDLEPLRRVTITFDSSNKIYLLIDTYNPPTLISRGSEKKYRYDINLISETKLLERVHLPNLSVTHILNGTSGVSYRDFIYDIVKYYINPQLGEGTCVLSSKYATLMPEMIFESPTAKELLNSVANTFPNNPSLVSMNNTVIGFVSLNQKGNEMNTNGIVSKEPYQSQQEYANALVSNLVNVVANKANVWAYERRFFQPNDGSALLTTNNLCAKIDNARIEEVWRFMINSVELKCKCETSESSVTVSVTTDVDLVDYVIEERIYNTLYVGKSSYDSSYKLGHLVFKQDGDTIDNLSYREDKFIGQTDYSINVAIKDKVMSRTFGLLALCQEVDSTITSVTSVEILTSPLNMTYSIVYKSMGDFKAKTYKDDSKGINVQSIDNQSSQMINYMSFTKVEKEKINRLGNDIIVINQRLSSEEADIALGDYLIENGVEYIVAKTTHRYFGSYKMVTSYLSPNFLQKNAYYGLQYRQRFTQLSDSTKSIVRNDISNFVVNIGIADSLDVTSDSYVSYLLKYYVCSPTSTYTKSAMGVKLVKLNTSTNSVLLDCETFGGDKTTSIICQFSDSYSAGLSSEVINGQVVSKYVPYTNSNGNLFFRVYQLLINPVDGEMEYSTDESVLRKYPLFTTGVISNYDIFHTLSEYTRKDSREVLKHTFQYDFKSISKDLILYDYFGMDNALTCIDKFVPSAHFSIYTSTSKIYTTSDTLGSGALSNSSISITSDGYNLHIKSTNGLDNIVSLGVQASSQTGNVLLFAINNVKDHLIDGELIIYGNMTQIY